MRHLSKYLVIFVLAVTMSVALYANGVNLNGNGSKAIAMGGAFVGLADDYSAIFWNPAGLTQMKETNLAFFATNVIPKATYKLPIAGIDATSANKMYPSPGVGFFKPLSPNIVFGIYGYAPSGLGAKWNGADLLPLSGGYNFKWESMLGVFTLSPAVAVKLSEQLSFGLALNLNYGMLKLKMPTELGQYEEDLNGMAFGATFGVLFKANDAISLGVCFKTPLKATLSGDATMGGASFYGFPTQDDAERKVKFPMWLGAGLCVRPAQNFTITVDAQYTNWEKLVNIPISYTNAGWKAAFEEGGLMPLEWRNVVQWRFGAEYGLSETFALRAGFYTDPIVAPLHTHNILLPELGYNWITFGFGYKSGNITLDLAVEYGMGKDVTVSFAQAGETGMPGTFGAKILVPNLALTIRL
ncbi:MAG: outer membrane protein transport protein [Acidobacteria bacterium]|jgi:long-chain fatty acid transport protein|nr:outer membrane protein transport protein [Acidobacteriota bacterium]